MIHLYSLSRRFGQLVAVDKVTCVIPSGAITALLGPNGAGKTTTLNMLTTLLEPTDGTAAVAGHDIRTDGPAVRRAIGYVPEHGTVYEGLSADEYLELAGRIRGLSSGEIRSRATPLLERFDVAEARGRRLGTFSKGMLRKILVTAALLHRPAVLFLDEPMDGLDVRSQKELADLLSELASDGICIVYSSHVLQQVEEVCSRVLLIHAGRLCWEGSLTDLQAAHAGHDLRDIFLELTADRTAERTMP
jgi:ABC-2 type transport system ATP-binding protein